VNLEEIEGIGSEEELCWGPLGVMRIFLQNRKWEKKKNLLGLPRIGCSKTSPPISERKGGFS